MKIIKRNWEAVTLIAMTGYDSSLHWVEILKIQAYHFTYPNFPLLNFISYDLFWTTYWTIAFLLTIKLLIKLNKNKK